MERMSGRVVVYGGRGALGTAIVTKFKESGWWVANVDMKASELADENILVEGDTWVQQVGAEWSCGQAWGADNLSASGGACVQQCWCCLEWGEAGCCGVHGRGVGWRISCQQGLYQEQ